MHRIQSAIPKGHKAVAPLDLQSQNKVARGKQRDIYFLTDASLDWPEARVPAVLKVPRYSERDNRQAWSKRIVRRLFPNSALRIITNETKYLNKLLARSGAGATSLPLPSFYGFIQTTAGPGAVWEAICDTNGNLAPTLASLAQNGEHDRFLEPLNQLVKTCFSMNIVAPDMHAGNLVYVHRNGAAHVVLIDGFGDHRLISIRASLPWYNRSSLHKSFEKIADKNGLDFDRERLVFSLRSSAAQDP